MFTNSYSTMTGFQGVNSPSIRSTGAMSLTGDFALTGELNHIEGVSAQTVVGTCATPATANVSNSGFSILSSSSGDINRYLMEAPTPGARKKIMFNCGLSTANIAYLFMCSSDNTNVLVGSATSGNIAIRSCGVSPMITLYGLSTSRWIVESISTASENGGAFSYVSSSCS